jgi:hypothetical protein
MDGYMDMTELTGTFFFCNYVVTPNKKSCVRLIECFICCIAHRQQDVFVHFVACFSL